MWKLFFFFLCCWRARRRNPGEGPSLLSPGIHSFPFKLGLPLGLPSTFLGKHGWVQYYCKAALREPGGLTHKNQQVFIVMNPIDLNLEPPILAVSLSSTLSFSPCIMDESRISYLYVPLLESDRVWIKRPAQGYHLCRSTRFPSLTIIMPAKRPNRRVCSLSLLRFFLINKTPAVRMHTLWEIAVR